MRAWLNLKQGIMKIAKLILLMGIVLLSACKENNNEDINSIIPEVMENYNLYKSNKLYNEIQESRVEKGVSAPFEIDTAERVGNLLKVTLSYQDLCETNTFNVIWSEDILLSRPPITDIVISRSTSSCVTHTETIQETLVIDLADLFEGDDMDLLEEEVYIYLYNASKKLGESKNRIVTDEGWVEKEED